MKKRSKLTLAVCLVLLFGISGSASAAQLDKYAEPVPVVSSGSFICETWINTSLDSFTVSGGSLSGAGWSISQGFVQYNLSGTFKEKETVVLSISGTMGEMGYQMEHRGNDLYMHVKCYDTEGNELEDLTKLIQVDDSSASTLSDTAAVEIPRYVNTVELYGTFTCSWSTPYSRASEIVGVKVVLQAETPPEVMPPAEPEVPFPVLEDEGCDPDWFDPEKNPGGIVKFGDLHGEVLVKRYGQDDDCYIFADYDTPLHHGDVIKTLRRSGAILSFSDMSTFVVKEDTTIILDIASPKKSNISILAGTVWGNLKRMAKDGSMEVEMAQAVAGIKGTTFICAENDGVSTLKVFEGTVEYTSKVSGETVMVSGGQMITAGSDGLGALTAFNAEEELSSWDENVRQLTAAAMAAHKSGPGIGLILVIAAVAVLAVVVVIVLLKNKKPASAASAPFVQAKFCARCGSTLTPNSRFCEKCGQQIT